MREKASFTIRTVKVTLFWPKATVAGVQPGHRSFSGSFGGGFGGDLLFYDANEGGGEFYTIDALGNLNRTQRYTNWRKTWSQIVPYYSGEGIEIHLLFYDASAGEGKFYRVDSAGGINLLRSYTGWRTTWSQIRE